jgi:small-conductance mechanosensitive channel
MSSPGPSVFFDSFGESSLNFELVVWTEEMSYWPRRFRSELNFGIERGLREAGIKIPFPQRDVHIRSGLSVPVEGPAPAS